MSGRDPDYEQTQRERRTAIRKKWSDMPRLTEPLPDEHAATIARLTAENARYREALTRLRDCDWIITLPDRMDAVRGIARRALADADTGEGMGEG